MALTDCEKVGDLDGAREGSGCCAGASDAVGLRACALGRGS
jgi:hypothetical protein